MLTVPDTLTSTEMIYPQVHFEKLCLMFIFCIVFDIYHGILRILFYRRFLRVFFFCQQIYVYAIMTASINMLWKLIQDMLKNIRHDWRSLFAK